MTALDELIDFADAAADPTRVLFWSGAGMSVPGPTSLPTGWELSERAFRAFFEPDALATVLGYHAQLGWLTADICDRTTTRNARLPRLETILGVAERRFAAEVAEILGDIAGAEPNWYHRFFARHLAVGGHHITANFDTCIEKAYAALPGRLGASGAGPAPLVEHFHNRLDSSTTAEQLGSTLERIQGGFDDATRGRLVDMAEAAGTIVFTGYSGSDFFDVDVAFAQLDPGRLSGRRVCWIAHSNRCSWHEVHPGPDRLPPLARHLREAGAEVRFFCGPTDGFLAELAARWRFALAAPAPAPRRVADIAVKVLQKDRRAATFSLYRELGIPAEIERLLNEHRSGGDKALDVDAAELLIARSEMLWEQGRWSTLRRMWRTEALPKGVDEITRAERIGACFWVQGRLVPAYLWLSRHWRKTSREQGADAAWPLAETLARVIEHMGRTPELRLFARLAARRTAARLGEPNQRSGVHVYRRHQDLKSSLAALAEGKERSTDDASTSRQWFTEAGTLLASVAYSHRTLRDLRANGGLNAPGELEGAYRRHFHYASAVGTIAGAWRTVLLPDAHRVFSVREALASVFALEYGNWHRVRILAAFALRRLMIHAKRS